MFNIISKVTSAGFALPIGVLLVQAGLTEPPGAFESQVWLLSVVGAAMGLIKIALWLKGSKDISTQPRVEPNGGMSSSIKTLVEVQLKNIDKLIDNQHSLSDSQNRLSDNQVRIIESQTKMQEMMGKLEEMMEKLCS